MAPIRVLIVSNYALVTVDFKDIIENAGNAQVVGESSVSSAAIDVIRRLGPDVVLVDVSANDAKVLALFKRIPEEIPRTKVIVVSDKDNDAFALQVLRLGVRAYLTHHEAIQELPRAIEAVMQGQVYLSPSAGGALVEGYRTKARARSNAAREQI